MKGIQKTNKKSSVSMALLFAASLCFPGATALFARGQSEAGTVKNTGTTKESAKSVSIAVFVPGVVSGSPIYEMLVAGVRKAAEEKPSVQVKVVEGGFNQADWESKVTSLAAGGNYDLIVSSNPALPAICDAVSKEFPKQKFLLLDGELSGNKQIYTLRYNQQEQGYMAGYIAALVSKDAISGGPSFKIGLIAGQEYPAMNDVILTAYKAGAQAVDPKFQVDFRVVGNWYDAARGAELASSMIHDGVRVILAISGGANQGIVQAASEAGAKVVWFDVNGYAVKPGTVVGSSILKQDLAAYEQVKRFLNGTLPFGQADLVGVAQGYVDFVQDDPNYTSAVPEALRKQQAVLVARLKSGQLRLDRPAK